MAFFQGRGIVLKRIRFNFLFPLEQSSTATPIKKENVAKKFRGNRLKDILP